MFISYERVISNKRKGDIIMVCRLNLDLIEQVCYERNGEEICLYPPTRFIGDDAKYAIKRAHNTDFDDIVDKIMKYKELI